MYTKYKLNDTEININENSNIAYPGHEAHFYGHWTNGF